MTIYLYIKEHRKTGLKYFGKTVHDPYTYDGSGKYWLRHINKHGREFVDTKEVFEFSCIEQASKFALSFSDKHNIVESDEWANLLPENAKDGGQNRGMSPSPETIEKLKEARRKRPGHSEETKRKISTTQKGKPKKKHTEEARKKMSESAKGRIPWNKGIPITEEQREKNRVAALGKKHTEESKAKMSKAVKGKKKTESHKEKISRYQSNRPKSHNDAIRNSRIKNGSYIHSEETKAKISASGKGRIPWNKGLKRDK